MAHVAVTPPSQNEGMPRQLVLIDENGRDWRLDDRTRERGKRGVARARKALENAARRQTAA